MKILVTLKRVPDPEQKVKWKGNALDLSGTNWVPNQFDEYAVETALRLTENASAGNARDGEVVVATIGPKDVSQQLRSALAMGADRAILVDGSDDNLDAELVARAVVKLVEQEKPDLVLMGKLAADSEDNQVGQLVAGYLNWPQATFAAGIAVVDDGKALHVIREVDSGVEIKRVALPAVVTVDLRIIAPQAIKNGKTAATHAYADGPRYASLKGIMAAKKKPIAETTLAALVPGSALRVKTVAIEAPPSRKAGVKVGSVEELVQKLHNEAKVL
ncbi:MAG: electron transfer flavoprotein subunit beta/FixA family protein [Myxococcales bacterium]|nr:electron transfer flavoprotein subunit beta/FixA family protein [Myxococcales bacterium]